MAMAVGSPAAHGVLQPAHHTLALWQAATELLLQLLRVDDVAAAQRLAGPGNGLALAARPVSTRARKGGRSGRVHGPGHAGGSSGSGSSDESDSTDDSEAD